MKRPSRASRYAVLFGAAMSLSLTVSASPFANGSFENPGMNTNFLAITTPNLAPTGWVGGALNGVALFYEKTGAFADVSAKDGLYLIGFGGSGSTGATLSQTFDTVAGDTYTVDFFIAAQQVGSGPQSYRLDALNGSSVITSDSGSIPALAEWKPHSLSFIAATSSSTIRFTDTSNGGAAVGINWALDAVSVTSVASVPEPETWALLLAGMGLIGALRRRAART
jgi:hypothetical protein